MPFKLSFIMEAGPAGWSEQWYTPISGRPDTVIDQIVTTQFIAAFLQLRANGVYLMGVRANDTENPRSAFLKIFEINAGNFNKLGGAQGDEPATCVLGYCRTVGGRHRPVMVRGMRDDLMVRDDSDNPLLDGQISLYLKGYTSAI